MSEKQDEIACSLLAKVAIVLVQPKFPENIGSAARCAMNLGVSRLIVVGERPTEPDALRVRAMATHNAAHILDSMEYHTDLATALAPFSFVVGTSARQGRKRRSLKTPRTLAEEIIPLLEKNNVALLFGPEDRGLTNDDLKFCQLISTIPTADFSSLNLAQAVAIHCYELFFAVQRLDRKAATPPKRATSREMENMYSHVERALGAIGFLREADSDYWMRNVRRFLGRVDLRSREVRVIRGICRQFLWFSKKSTADLE